MIARAMRQSREVFIKFGYAGLIFFTLKGTLWLTLPVIFGMYLN